VNITEAILEIISWALWTGQVESNALKVVKWLVSVHISTV
jgi:hypothetical protein